MPYSNWMLLGLPCCATGRAACLSDPTWPLNPAIKQLEPKAKRLSLQGGSARPTDYRLVWVDESTAESRISRVPLPYFFFSVSVSPGMCTGSNFQMMDVEIWLLFPCRDAASPRRPHYWWRSFLTVNKQDDLFQLDVACEISQHKIWHHFIHLLSVDT